MKIAVLTGSPHKNGATALLADRFIEGARAKGHEIYRFDAAFRNIHPCLGWDDTEKLIYDIADEIK